MTRKQSIFDYKVLTVWINGVALITPFAAIKIVLRNIEMIATSLDNDLPVGYTTKKQL